MLRNQQRTPAAAVLIMTSWCGFALPEHGFTNELSPPGEQIPTASDSGSLREREVAMSQEESDKPCRRSRNARALDFWVGSWVVMDLERKQVYGINRIERALDGCAVFEHWESATGGNGTSLFYFDVHGDRWSQVWVTEDTSRVGGLKLKYQTDDAPDLAVRFQGVLTGSNGEIHDRTTLTPMADGAVRQTIEVSRDTDGTWQTTFDALYVPPGR